MSHKYYSSLFTPREMDLPQRVHGFLRVCELACAWYEWQDRRGDEPVAHFCDGVVTYWWDYETLREPSFDQLFNRPLDPDEKWSGWPSRERFAYQKGAIVGYQLREEFDDG